MSQYDVYVLGNALVDLEYKVTEATLAELGVEKGVMTLVDAARQQQLLASLNGVEHIKACGGSAANSACAIAEFGSKVFLSINVADDMLGHFYFDDLKRLSIDTNLVRDNLEHGITGTCVAMITPDTERSMNTFLGISEQLSEASINTTALQQAQYLYLEGYIVTSPSARAAAIQARIRAEQHHVKVAMTLSDPNMVSYFKDGLLDMLGDGVDLLFCNLHEAELFCDSDDINVIKEVLKQVAKMFAVTLGSEGCLLFDGTDFIELQGETITPVDTLGAGDMFAGAFLRALTQGCDFRQAGEFANRAAARIVQKFGPRLTKVEAQALL